MSVFDEVRSTAREVKRPVLLWGQVVGVSPTTVRLARDQTDVTITIALSSYTPTTTDKVVVAKVGGAWAILGDLVSI